jgi:hypothetical protein
MGRTKGALNKKTIEKMKKEGKTVPAQKSAVKAKKEEPTAVPADVASSEVKE